MLDLYQYLIKISPEGLSDGYFSTELAEFPCPAALLQSPLRRARLPRRFFGFA
jgi:hypothetical protein